MMTISTLGIYTREQKTSTHRTDDLSIAVERHVQRCYGSNCRFAGTPHIGQPVISYIGRPSRTGGEDVVADVKLWVEN